MGLGDFLKKLISGEEEDAELRAARARHGMAVDKEERKKERGKAERERRAIEAEKYDVWEELRTMRTSFFLGSWATKKIMPPRTDKLKEELEEIERKKEAEQKQKEDGEGEGLG